jgi:2-polyprenyl-6-methoxyphenol hydroxylase-like FAD-dependent oxidoreductase
MWRVTYGDTVPGLTDEEYLARRPWHFKAILPGNPDPDQYRIEHTNIYRIHNRCVDSFKVGRILLAADAAHVGRPKYVFQTFADHRDCFSRYAIRWAAMAA